MGKCSNQNQFLQITLDRELVKVVDGIIETINSKADKKSPKLTRSKFIQDILIAFITDVDEETKKQERKENNNNA